MEAINSYIKSEKFFIEIIFLSENFVVYDTS